MVASTQQWEGGLERVDDASRVSFRKHRARLSHFPRRQQQLPLRPQRCRNLACAGNKQAVTLSRNPLLPLLPSKHGLVRLHRRLRRGALRLQQYQRRLRALLRGELCPGQELRHVGARLWSECLQRCSEAVAERSKRACQRVALTLDRLVQGRAQPGFETLPLLQRRRYPVHSRLLPGKRLTPLLQMSQGLTQGGRSLRLDGNGSRCVPAIDALQFELFCSAGDTI